MSGYGSGESLETDSSVAPGHAGSPGDTEAAVLMRNGIGRTTVSHYHVDGYRYGHLADALAQVTRGAQGRKTHG